MEEETVIQEQPAELNQESEPKPEKAKPRRGYLTKSGKRQVKKTSIKRRGKPVEALVSPDPAIAIEKVYDTPKKATEPWRPASILTSTHRPGYRSKWCRKDILEKRIAEGWEPRRKTEKDRLHSPESTIVDGSPLSDYITKRNLVLCDMPEELAKSREEYFESLTKGALQSEVDKFKGEVNIPENKGSHVYGEIRIT